MDDAKSNPAHLSREVCTDLNVDRFCKPMIESCTNRFNQGAKGVDDNSPTCAFSLQGTIQKRLANPVLRTQILGEAGAYFYSQLHSDQALQACCGDLGDQGKVNRCRNTFGSAKFFVLKGLGLSDRTAMTDGLEVQLSDAEILRFGTKQALENVILHELGHVCEESRARGDQFSDTLGWLNECDSSSLIDWRKKMILSNLGDKAGDCYIKAAEDFSDNFGGICKVERYAEAYAEAFRQRVARGPAEWQYYCGVVESWKKYRGDANSWDTHPSARRTIECALKDPIILKKLCPGN
ncbi:MAG: hypothetical protein ACXVBW_02795 [Bdellovibrionota bacterium]